LLREPAEDCFLETTSILHGAASYLRAATTATVFFSRGASP
jgi:hypothetical protein